MEGKAFPFIFLSSILVVTLVCYNTSEVAAIQ